MEAFAGWSVCSARAHEKPCVRTKPGGGRSPAVRPAASSRGRGFAWEKHLGAQSSRCACGGPSTSRAGGRPGARLQPGPAQCASVPLGSRRRLPPRRARDPRRPPCLLCSGRWAEGVRNLGSGSPDQPSPAAAPEEAGPIPTRGANQRAPSRSWGRPARARAGRGRPGCGRLALGYTGVTAVYGVRAGSRGERGYEGPGDRSCAPSTSTPSAVAESFPPLSGIRAGHVTRFNQQDLGERTSDWSPGLRRPQLPVLLKCY